VIFLDPEFHGRRDGDKPEWPPSPLRLFQALVAAAAARWGERQRLASAVPALKWLAEQSPPLIRAPAATEGAAYCLSVPNNAMDIVARAWVRGHETGKGDANPATHRVMKTIRSTHLPDGDTVFYLWDLPNSLTDEVRAHVEVLRAAARSMAALGWGVDLVAGNGRVLSAAEAGQIPGEHWQPTSDPTAEGLRVPTSGTLEALIDRHDSFLNRLQGGGLVPLPPLSAFRVVGYRRATDPPLRRWAAFRLRHPTEDRYAPVAQTRANHVAAMTRCTTARLAIEQGQPGEWIDRYVHGHRHKDEESAPRFSYLPLPSIERRGQGTLVLGSIRRVLVAEFGEAGQSYLHWARQMLPGQFLTDDKTGDRQVMLTPLTGGDWVLQQYTDNADTWATVTPIVLPGSDEGKFAKAEKLFFKALGHAGYASDLLADFELRNVAFWPGGDLALKFQRPDYLRQDRWSVYHVRLRWTRAIKGPLAIGAGRHCGLGIFAAMNNR
jgi:CRISPR-associated protein Csb2